MKIQTNKVFADINIEVYTHESSVNNNANEIHLLFSNRMIKF